MNVQELRIGNYIEVEGLYATITALYINEAGHIKVKLADGKASEIKADDAKPIALTKELLIKSCGFDSFGKYKIGLDNHRYFLTLEDDYIVLSNRESEPVIHFWDVKNLHQLQNLYFALMAKEVEIVFDK